MAFDFAKAGRPLHGYPVGTHLGFQEIKPLVLDDLQHKLKGFSINWHYEKFVEANKNVIPSRPGVYMFTVHLGVAGIERHSIILYFGEAKNLRTRFKQYLRERDGVQPTDREHIKKMLNIYRNRVEFGYCCLGRYQVEQVQDILIEAFDPCCNRQKAKAQPAFDGGG